MSFNKSNCKRIGGSFSKSISGINFSRSRILNQSLSIIILLFISYFVVNFIGCCAYSFTGASVPKHIKSIAIPIANDRSGSGEPGLRENFTDQLTQKFIDDNTLQFADKSNANAVLECTITSLTDAPAVVAAGENVTSRRITITVQVVYRDLVKRKTIFDKSFSNYADYSANGSLSQRNEAISKAIDKITEDILLDTVSGW